MTGKKIPSDLLIVIVFVLLTDIFVLTPELSDTVIRNILGVPLVLFLPGNSLIAALFPAKCDIDGIERIALSFGLSIAIAVSYTHLYRDGTLKSEGIEKQAIQFQDLLDDLHRVLS